jgi:hypothetical protein
MQLRLAVQSPLTSAKLGLQITLFSEAITRSAFEAALSGPNPQDSGFSVLQTTTVPLTAVGLRQPDGTLSLDLPVSSSLFTKTPKAPANGTLLSFPSGASPGVYPVEIGLVGGEGPSTLAAFTTFLVLAPDGAARPIHFAVTFQIGASPATTVDGVPAPALADEQELEELASVLEANRSVSVSIALYPQFVAALTAAAVTLPHPSQAQHEAELHAQAALGALRALDAMRNVQFLTEPYAAIDVAGAARGGAAGEVATQLRTGARTAEDAGLHVTAGYTAAPATLGEHGVRLLAASGTRFLELPSADAEQPLNPQAASWQYPLWAPFVVQGSNVVADASDRYLESHLESRSAPVLGANQLLADLADLYFAEQNDPPRGVSLLVPSGWHPSAPDLHLFLEGLVTGLESSPVIRSNTLSQFFSAVPPGSAETPPGSSASPLATGGLASPRVPAGDLLSAPALAAARSQLAALASTIPTEPRLLAGLGTRILLSETLGLSAGERGGYLGSVPAQLGAARASLSLPSGKTITMTSLSAKIPISISSSAATPLDVYLVVSSPNNELTFTHNRFAMTLRRANNTIDVRVQARAAGDFELGLKLITRVGGVVLAQSKLTIRSTAISGVAVVLTAGAAAFLVVWWARSALKRRRTGRHLKGSATPAPST